MLEMARSALQQYATKFKLDGLSYEELSGMHRSISDIVEAIGTTADTTEEKKNHTLSLLPDTLKAINTAYGSKNGGEGQ
jgi:serine/threonine-protein kinase